MNGEDQVLALLEMADPVPDPDGFAVDVSRPVTLVDSRFGSDIMQEAQRSTVRSDAPNRNVWIIGVAAAVVLAVGVVVAMLVATQQEPAQPAPVEGAAQIAAVETWIDAKNTGDWEALIGGLVGEERDGFAAYKNQFDAGLVANERLTIIEPCVYGGETDSGQPTVVCGLTRTNDFTDTLGVVDSGRSEFVLDADLGIVAWNDNLESNDPDDDHVMAFMLWMLTEHPREYVQLSAYASNWYARTPRDMEIALSFVEEFAAQSDVYPLTP